MEYIHTPSNDKLSYAKLVSVAGQAHIWHVYDPYMCIFVYKCMTYICNMYLCMYVCIYVCMYVCMHVEEMHVCMYVCTYVYVCI